MTDVSYAPRSLVGREADLRAALRAGLSRWDSFSMMLAFARGETAAWVDAHIRPIIETQLGRTAQLSGITGSVRLVAAEPAVEAALLALRAPFLSKVSATVTRFLVSLIGKLLVRRGVVVTTAAASHAAGPIALLVDGATLGLLASDLWRLRDDLIEAIIAAVYAA